MLRKKLSNEDLELIEHKGPNQNIRDIVLGNDHPKKFAPSIYGLFSNETKDTVERRINESNYIPVPRTGK